MKKLINLLLITALFSFGFSLTYADSSERLKATGENITGTTEDTVGAATGDTKMQVKGKLNKAKSKMRHKKEDVKDNM